MPTAARRREEAAAAAAALRAQQARRLARRRALTLGAAVTFLVLVVAAVAVIVTQSSHVRAPSVASAHGGLVVDAAGLVTPAADDPGPDGRAGTADDVAWPGGLARPGGPVVVSVYLDFMCPWCGLLERTNGETLQSLVASGDIVLDWHPVAVNDHVSAGSRYPTRAAAAAFAVAQGDPQHLTAFMERLMAQDVQPAEGTPGLTDAELATIAKDLGAPQPVLDDITSRTWVPYVTHATDLASRDLGGFGTPTVLLNGRQLAQDVDWRQDGALAAAIAGAAGA